MLERLKSTGGDRPDYPTLNDLAVAFDRLRCSFYTAGPPTHSRALTGLRRSGASSNSCAHLKDAVLVAKRLGDQCGRVVGDDPHAELALVAMRMLCNFVAEFIVPTRNQAQSALRMGHQGRHTSVRINSALRLLE